MTPPTSPLPINTTGDPVLDVICDENPFVLILRPDSTVILSADGLSLADSVELLTSAVTALSAEHARQTAEGEHSETTFPPCDCPECSEARK